MQYSIEIKNANTAVLQLSSLLDPTENQRVIEGLVGQMSQGIVQWIINLQEMAYLNSTGLNFLISVLTRTRTLGGEVVIVGVSEKIQQVLVLTRLQSMFAIHPDVESALKFLSSQSHITETPDNQ